MKKEVLSRIPAGSKASFEYDIFPEFVGNKFFGHVAEGPLIDIGTPERYAFANENIELLC